MQELKQVKILKELELDVLPRSCGNPAQQIIHNGKQYLLWIRQMNGRATCFTSHNAYTDFNKYNEPSEVKLKNIFFDFDIGNGYNFYDVAKDVIKTSKYLSNCDIQHSVVFSGNKGYHIYIHVKPGYYDLGNKLSLYYQNLTNHINEELELNTMDLQCAEPKRLCRIPGTFYTSKGKITDRKCYPLSNNIDIPTKKEEMYSISKNRMPDPPYKRKGRKYSLEEIMESLNVEHTRKNNIEYDKKTECSIPNSLFMKLVSKFFRPCVFNELKKSNPDHFVRIASCMKIQKIYSCEKAKKIFSNLAEEAKWIDRHNESRRNYHIESVYKKDYVLPSCKTLKQRGYCIEGCEYDEH